MTPPHINTKQQAARALQRLHVFAMLSRMATNSTYVDSAGVVRETQFPAGSNAGSNSPDMSAPTTAYTTPRGYQQLSSDQLGTARGLTVPSGAMRAVIQNNGAQSVRWRNDGTAPTATTGQRIIGGDGVEAIGNLGAYSFIREAEGVQLDINYYG